MITGAAKEQSPISSPCRSRWRVWRERVALVLLGPLVFFSGAEATLRLVGYGYPTTFLIKAESGTNYITNEAFAWQFFSRATPLKPWLFTLASKRPGAIRICILGESAAMGTPDPAFCFGRMLQAQLRHGYPDREFEVINAAMRGIDSHIIRLIARECAAHQVDLFIAYTGNNEMSGTHAPEPNSPRWKQLLFLIRASQWAKSTRFGQLIDSLASGGLDDAGPAVDMAYFRKRRLRADDWHRKPTLANFQANLEAISRTTARAGAKLILCTVPANLKDCPPLASLHRPYLADADRARWEKEYAQGAELESAGQKELAIGHYAAAALLDDHYAELHFRLGQCYLAAGKTNHAREQFHLALDWDALAFRADSTINANIRRVASARLGAVWLADIEEAFTRDSIPGFGLFGDHVHLTFAGNDALARALYGTVVEALGLDSRKHPAAPLSPQECAQIVGYTACDELKAISATVQLTARPPFLDQMDHARRQAAAESDIQNRFAAFTGRDAEVCLAAYQTVIRREPDYWPIRFLRASLCQDLGRYPEAIEQFRRLTEEYPQSNRFTVPFAVCLFRSGDRRGAVALLEHGLCLNPADPQIRVMLKQLYAGKTK
jgi:tetratricopeptide (TPR) repeat protein